jgi:hypothetical protein
MKIAVAMGRPWGQAERPEINARIRRRKRSGQSGSPAGETDTCTNKPLSPPFSIQCAVGTLGKGRTLESGVKSLLTLAQELDSDFGSSHFFRGESRCWQTCCSAWLGTTSIRHTVVDSTRSKLATFPSQLERKTGRRKTGPSEKRGRAKNGRVAPGVASRGSHRSVRAGFPHTVRGNTFASRRNAANSSYSSVRPSKQFVLKSPFDRLYVP